MTDQLLTLPEFAKHIAASESTARRIIDRGEIACYRVGRSGLRVRVSDVEAYLAARRTPEEVGDLKSLVARAVERAKQRRATA